METDNKFIQAANLLQGNAYRNGHENQSGSKLLEALGYCEQSKDLNLAEVPNSLPNLMLFASKLDTVFARTVPTMPNLFFFGAQRTVQIDGSIEALSNTTPIKFNYAGRGVTRRQAFESCVGEAVEHDAMFLRKTDPRLEYLPKKLFRVLSPNRTSKIEPSTGYAAGSQIEQAVQSSIFECCERDALAKWFHGDATLRRINKNQRLNRIERHLREHQNIRTELFLIDVNEQIYPTVIAHSTVNEEIITGYGSGLSLESASISALTELGQGELGLLMEQSMKTPPPFGFITRSKFFQKNSNLFSIDGKLTADNKFICSCIEFESFDITIPEIGVPCVKSQNQNMRDVCLEIKAGEIGPL